jgi:hypothetical protein
MSATAIPAARRAHIACGVEAGAKARQPGIPLSMICQVIQAANSSKAIKTTKHPKTPKVLLSRQSLTSDLGC